METLIGKCLTCGKTIQISRCGETTGGGTYHIVCFECNERNSRQSVPLPILWRWVVGWILVIGLIMGVFLVILVFGGH
jgi:hypothetical protein